MNQEELKKKIYTIMEQHKVGILSSVKNSKPHARFMTFAHDDDFNFYSPTHRETHKVEEVEANPDVHILIGYSGEGYGDTYLEVEGQVKIRDHQDLKDFLWTDQMERWFSSKTDSDYIVLEIFPESIRYMDEDGPEVLEL